ncbi:cardiolipin synthase [Paraferrimonas sp. SM1919]|uniref:cardiolipin synthase n=1 Tax=Paraferrimonas sp. SM1919 TaxID=2662263 RepID=UPI0013D60311|nr:cardiolipin synthase [Paraferrimonas sp. SM1919]
MDHFYQVLSIIIVGLYWLLVATVSFRIALKRRAFGVSIAWLLLIYILPIVGVAVYLLFGELNLGQMRSKRALNMFRHYRRWFEDIKPNSKQLSAHARPIHELSLRRLGIPSQFGHDIKLFSDTELILSALIDDINQAQTSIAMEFYIWQPGGLADEVASALIEASKRGVKIRLLLDAAGSKVFFSTKWPARFKGEGIEVVKALGVHPLRMFMRRLDLRQHRKIVVIDDKVAYTGSMNLVDARYFKTGAGVGQWIDIMVRIQGPSVPVLSSVQAWDWEFETGQRYLQEISRQSSQHYEDNYALQVIPSGHGLPENVIQQILLLNIHHAQKSIILTSPYFVPSESLLEALKMAAYRGVKVQLIVPLKNDSLMVGWASRSYFAELLEAGVEIHQFDGGLLHTKSMLVDGEHSLIGTVNLDIRSLRLNSEVSLAIDSPAFCQQLHQLLESYLQSAKPLSLANWRQRPTYKKLLEQFFYMFGPLL